MKMNLDILLIAHENDFVIYLRKRLAARGIGVLIASNSEDAMRLVRRHHIEIVVLDLLTPGIDGLDIIRKLKELKPEPRVILLTGKETNRIAAQGMKLGAEGCIPNPCDLESLLGSIQRARPMC